MYFDVLESSPNEIYFFDPVSLRFEYVSLGARRRLGYSDERIKAMTPLEIAPELDPAAFRRMVLSLASGAESQVVLETNHRRADGTCYPVEAHLKVVGEAPQRLCLLIAIDITRRKRVEDDLSRRTRQLEILSKTTRTINTVLEVPTVLRTLVASAMELVNAQCGAAGLMRNGEMVFTEYNSGGEILPVTMSFPPGRGVPGHVIQTRRPYVTNDACTDPLVVPEIRQQLGFYDLVNVPIIGREGKLLGAFTIHNSAGRRGFDSSDVEMLESLAAGAAVALENSELLVERSRIEESLRSQSELFEKIIDSIPIMVALLDPQGRFELVNREWQRVLGMSLEDGRNSDVLSLGFPDPATRKQVLESIQEASGKWRLFPCRVRGGRTRDVLWATVRLTDGHVIGIGQDITERKQLEEQFRQAQKMEAVGRLAGGMAHDFNNLLTVITGYSQLLMMDRSAGEPVEPYAEEILRASERASRLTSQLLAFSRRQVVQRKVVDLNSIVKSMEPMLRRMIGEDIQLGCALDPSIPNVKVDPGQIEQVLANLSVNARDAMPNGGKIMIETARAEASGLGQGTRSMVMLAFSDTGTGMDSEVKAHLFEPFFTTKEKGKGTGLGLSTVYGIVKQSEGEIHVYSEPGRGATFKIYFPEVGGVAERLPHIAGRAEMPRGSETILVVEDEDSVRKLIHSILANQGYKVLEAQNGEEALQVARSMEAVPELMISDVVMPQMTGPQLTAEMLPQFPALKVLYISGYTFNAVVQQDLLKPNVSFLQKPFTPEALTRKVRDVLAAHDERSPL